MTPPATIEAGDTPSHLSHTTPASTIFVNDGSHMSEETPNLQLAWDSTSLGLLKECAKRYYYQIILGFQPRGLSIHLHFGQLFHAGVEKYYHSTASGLDHNAASRDMARWVLEASGSRDPSGVFTPWTPPPEDPNSSLKNRLTLLRSLIWFVEDQRDSPLTTLILSNGKPAVELSFRFHAFDVGHEAITLCGHLDRLVSLNDRVWVNDHKTTKGQLNASFFRSFTPHNQFTLYTIAGKVVLDKPCEGVLVGGVQIGVNFTRSTFAQVPRPEAVLTEWLADAQYWIAQARQFALTNHWPMNDKSCGNYGGCPFARVCAVAPQHRSSWLKADYQKWEWNPLTVRGDV